MRHVVCIALLWVVSCSNTVPEKPHEYSTIENWTEVITADGEKLAVNEGDLVLEPLPEPTPEEAASLIYGRVADPKDWPATVYSTQRSGNAYSRCTATLIGERTLLTAAHCVGDQKNASFKAGGVQYNSICTRAPGYPKNKTADWALCLIDKVVKGIPFERVNQDPKLVKFADEVLLTGYGCVKSPGTGGNDGKYRIGEARITKVPDGKSNDYVTSGGSALCFGDSGGPAFFLQGKQRLVISVNSRGNIRDTSYLSSVATEEAKAFFSDWLSKHKQKFCGAQSKAKVCR